MLRVTIDLIPFGIGTPKKLAEIHIANDGTGDVDNGNYMAKLHPDNTWNDKVVTDWARYKSPIALLAEVLKHYYG